MNFLDIIIIALMVFFLVKGILRGFVQEFFSLCGIVLGIWLGIRFLPQMTDLLSPLLSSLSHLIIQVISFAVVFLAVIILCNLLGWSIKKLFKKALIGWFDRTLGAGFAFVKGIILIYLGIVLLTFFLPMKSPLIAQSKLAPIVITSYQSMARIISPQTYKKLKKQFMKKKDAAVDENPSPSGGK